MWGIFKTDHYERRLKRYEKKKNKRLELAAVLNNLDIFLKSLQAGKTPKPFAYGFLHSEPADVIAIDQKGAGAKIAATRLYVYPDMQTETLYLLTLGDKATQPADIEDCKTFVKQIRQKAHGGNVHDHESGREEKERGKDS